jgi:hypothetical protein
MRLSPTDIISAKRQLIKMHYYGRVGHLGGNLSALDAMYCRRVTRQARITSHSGLSV